TFALICGHISALEDMNSWADVIKAPLYYILLAATVIITVLVVIAFRKIQLKVPTGNLDEVPSIFETNEA
ncbi:MAG: hypothetical protein II053_01805, partial [Bacteroidales bacterium]|nr:hypothetical protein [Bacteroidales bacterium]